MRQKSGHDKCVEDRGFSIDDTVFVRNFAGTGSTWLPGVIIEARGELTFHIQLDDGHVFCRHIDYIRRHTCSIPTTHTEEGSDDFLPPMTDRAQDRPNPPVHALITAPRQCSQPRHPPDGFMYIHSTEGGM